MVGDKSDIMYYTGYGIAGILVGVFVLLWSFSILKPLQAFGLWALFVGFAAIVLGCLKIASPRGMPTIIGFGALLVIISGCLSAFSFQFLSPWSCVAIIIILFSAGLVCYGLITLRRE
jgi:hypothetical protein